MPDKTYSRPRDKSLQAYKDWITGVVRRLNPNAKDTMTEAEWEESWKEFWSKAEGNKDDSEAPASEE